MRDLKACSWTSIPSSLWPFGLLSEPLTVICEQGALFSIYKKLKWNGILHNECLSDWSSCHRVVEVHRSFSEHSDWYCGQYANRQPIGLEKVIKNVTATCVQDFYHRWYRPEHMAIVAVGDFPDIEVLYRCLFVFASKLVVRSFSSFLSCLSILYTVLKNKERVDLAKHSRPIKTWRCWCQLLVSLWNCIHFWRKAGVFGPIALLECFKIVSSNDYFPHWGIYSN